MKQSHLLNVIRWMVSLTDRMKKFVSCLAQYLHWMRSSVSHSLKSRVNEKVICIAWWQLTCELYIWLNIKLLCQLTTKNQHKHHGLHCFLISDIWNYTPEEIAFSLPHSVLIFQQLSNNKKTLVAHIMLKLQRKINMQLKKTTQINDNETEAWGQHKYTENSLLS